MCARSSGTVAQYFDFYINPDNLIRLSRTEEVMSLVKTSRRLTLALLVVAVTVVSAHAADVKLLNVSYDPTRELYQDAQLRPDLSTRAEMS